MENSSTFEVKTELFDGPIDLLLHLVKKNELPIEKLSLAFICSQYLSYLDTMRQLDLDVAGDYLVIAATLVSIKSSVLLNEPVQVVVDEDGNLVDAHEQLLERLREAAVFKEASEKLSARGVLNVDVFAPPPLLRYFETLEESFVSHDPFLLGKAFKKLLDRLPDETSFKITVDSVSITERMMKILGSLQSLGGAVVFYKLIPDLTSRGEIIGTFVALLELCKRGAIRVHQNDVFEDIIISQLGEDEVKGSDVEAANA